MHSDMWANGSHSYSNHHSVQVKKGFTEVVPKDMTPWTNFLQLDFSSCLFSLPSSTTISPSKDESIYLVRALIITSRNATTDTTDLCSANRDFPAPSSAPLPHVCVHTAFFSSGLGSVALRWTSPCHPLQVLCQAVVTLALWTSLMLPCVWSLYCLFLMFALNSRCFLIQSRLLVPRTPSELNSTIVNFWIHLK